MISSTVILSFINPIGRFYLFDAVDGRDGGEDDNDQWEEETKREEEDIVTEI